MMEGPDRPYTYSFEPARPNPPHPPTARTDGVGPGTATGSSGSGGTPHPPRPAAATSSGSMARATGTRPEEATVPYRPARDVFGAGGSGSGSGSGSGRGPTGSGSPWSDPVKPPKAPAAAAATTTAPALDPATLFRGAGSSTVRSTSHGGSSPAKVDVVFLMDVTGSMGSWLDACKGKIVAISQEVVAKFPGSDVRFAFVGYRDLWNDGPYDVFDFGTAEDIRRQLQPVDARGGDDSAEDVAGGLRHVLNLRFRSPAARLLIHIADAPAHGSRYNGGLDDRRPVIPPEDELEPIMVKLAKKKVDYYFLRLNNYTDMMTAAMRGAYDACTSKNNPFVIITLDSNVGEFLRAVTECVTASMASLGF